MFHKYTRGKGRPSIKQTGPSACSAIKTSSTECLYGAVNAGIIGASGKRWNKKSEKKKALLPPPQNQHCKEVIRIRGGTALCRPGEHDGTWGNVFHRGSDIRHPASWKPFTSPVPNNLTSIWSACQDEDRRYSTLQHIQIAKTTAGSHTLSSPAYLLNPHLLKLTQTWNPTPQRELSPYSAISQVHESTACLGLLYINPFSCAGTLQTAEASAQGRLTWRAAEWMNSLRSWRRTIQHTHKPAHIRCNNTSTVLQKVNATLLILSPFREIWQKKWQKNGRKYCFNLFNVNILYCLLW